MRAPYFSHDEDARNDPKVTKIRAKYGMEGYGCYFAMLEMFSSESSHALDYSDDQFEALTYDLRVNIDIKDFVDRCVDVGLFQTDGTRFWSDAFNRRNDEVVKKAKERSEKAKKAIEARWDKAKKEKNEALAVPEHEINSDSADDSDFGIDKDWKRVAVEYEANIGMLPTGRAAEMLVSYYEDMGADVMCKAIEATNMAHPSNPHTFLMAILREWDKLEVRTVEQAEAATLDHNRKNEARKKWKDGAENGEQPKQTIRGNFY